MNKIISFILVLILYPGYSQNSSNKNFKKTIETETYGVKYSDGKMHIFTSEINEIKYNIKGQELEAIRKTYYNRKPYQTSKTTFFYNDQENISYTNTLILEDSLQYKTQYTYSNNKLIQINSYFIFKEKETKYNEEYFYNENKKIIKSNYMCLEKHIDSDHKLRDLIAEYKYDKKERIIESDWTKSDSTYKYNRIVHVRNRKGLITKRKEYNKNNDLVKATHCKYVFDKKNNWTIRKFYENKILVKSIYREIEYFD